MGAEVFGDGAEADTGEEVDREAGVPWVIGWENAVVMLGHGLVAEARLQLLEADLFYDGFEEDFDEDARAAGCILFVEIDD